MPTGLIILFAVTALIFFGLAHRVLDRMRLTDTQALLFLALMIAGSFLDLPLVRGGETTLSVNVGGALVPAGLAIYLLNRAGTSKERWRAVLAAVGTAVAIRLIGSLSTFDPPRTNIIDPLWLSALVGGALGYLAGRSRRAAFVAGTMGVVLADVAHAIRALASGMRSDVSIGGAGVFDAVVVAGVIAVLLAEVFGESRERLQGGPRLSGERPLALYQDEGVGDGEGASPREDGQRRGEGENGHDA